MIFRPKKTKFIKNHKKGVRTRNLKNIGISIKSFYSNSIILVSMESSRISSNQLTSFINVVKKSFKKEAIIRIILFPHFSVSKSPTGIRIGKGKGSTSTFACKTYPGEIIVEISSFNNKKVMKIINLAIKKLSIKTKLYESFIVLPLFL